MMEFTITEETIAVMKAAEFGRIKMMEFTITEETLLVVACCVVFVMILLGLGILLTPFFDL